MKYAPVLTPIDMRRLEEETMAFKKIDDQQLMANAAEALFLHMVKKNHIHTHQSILVLAGKGHNGGDACLIFDHLLSNGYHADLIVFSDNLTLTKQHPCHPESSFHTRQYAYLTDDANDPLLIQKIEQADVIIDGLFGTGFKGVPDQSHHMLFESIRLSSASIISIDCPSGLSLINGLGKDAIRADVTLVVETLKVGHLIQDGLDLCGQLEIVSCGMIKPSDFSAFYVKESVHLTYPKRKHHTHKYHYGHLAIIGGSKEMMGAPYLSGHAGYRSGVGMVTQLYHESCFDDRFNLMPELLSRSFVDGASLSVALHKKQAIAFGMGFGKTFDAFDMMSLLLHLDVPMIVDADGLSYLRLHLDHLHDNHRIVITPHMKEFADLIKIDIHDLMQDPLSYVKNFVQSYPITLCLKGPSTIIANRDVTYVVQSGHPGLAKAGSGDVLSGIIGALLALGRSPIDAALLGVYVHGHAADLAKRHHGEDGMIATDVIECIPKVIRKLKSKVS